MRRQRLNGEKLARCVVASHGNNLGDHASAVPSGQMRDEVDRLSDGFADAPVWQPNVGGEHAVCETCQRLLGVFA